MEEGTKYKIMTIIQQKIKIGKKDNMILLVHILELKQQTLSWELCGNIAYNLYGYSDSKDISNIGMMGDGQFQIFADQCITIAGGASVDGGVCVNIVGLKVMSQ